MNLTDNISSNLFLPLAGRNIWGRFNSY